MMQGSESEHEALRGRRSGKQAAELEWRENMVESKKYCLEYEEYEEKGLEPDYVIEKILADPDFPGLKELIIGDWGAWEGSCQPIIDGIVERADTFSHIEKLFIGDMDYEECEVSWINQGDYSKLWAALPGLRELTIKGSQDLELGEISHDRLESLTIICGGLGSDVIASIQKAKLPALKKLLLYIGIEDYGFDGNADTIQKLLEEAAFPSLTYLGIVDSEMQDEIVPIVLDSKFMNQIETLDLSLGTLTDQGGTILLERLPSFSGVKKLDVHYHYLSDEMMKKLQELPMEVDVSEQEKAYEYKGETYYSAMLTE